MSIYLLYKYKIFSIIDVYQVSNLYAKKIDVYNDKNKKQVTGRILPKSKPRRMIKIKCANSYNFENK